MVDRAGGEEKRTVVLLRFLRVIALIDLGIVVVVGLLCWSADWRTAEQFGQILAWAGAIAIGLGVASQLGGWGLTRSPDVLLAQSVGRENISDRTKRTARDLVRAYDFVIMLAAAGLVAVGIGELVRFVWA